MSTLYPVTSMSIAKGFPFFPVNCMYSRVPNKHRPTFINYGSFFQGLRSYLRGLRLLILTNFFHKTICIARFKKVDDIVDSFCEDFEKRK